MRRTIVVHTRLAGHMARVDAARAGGMSKRKIAISLGVGATAAGDCNRNTKRFQSRLRSAKLRHGQASIEDVDYRTSRRLDKALFQQLGSRISGRTENVDAWRCLSLRDCVAHTPAYLVNGGAPANGGR